jgi:hypothetical protein
LLLTDLAMRAYLLGQATEAEAARLEERLLEDEEMFQTLCSVEDDLFDEYARGGLTAQERQRFADRYGSDRGRLLVARALARRSADLSAVAQSAKVEGAKAARSAKGANLSLPRRSAKGAKAGHWVPLAAAAALVVAVGATMWMRDRPANVASSAPAAPQKPAAVPAVLLITLGTSRSAADATAVALPHEAPALDLRVRLDPADRFDRYIMELTSESGAVVWHVEDARLTTVGGEPIVAATVPAAALQSGAFELAVRGANGNAASEALGFATVRINRNP